MHKGNTDEKQTRNIDWTIWYFSFIVYPIHQYKSYDKIEKMSQKELVNLIENVMILELSPIVPIPYKGKIEQTISYSYPELTANCPMTLIQDLYTVNIIFVPDNVSQGELESFKNRLISHVDIFYQTDTAALPGQQACLHGWACRPSPYAESSEASWVLQW